MVPSKLGFFKIYIMNAYRANVYQITDSELFAHSNISVTPSGQSLGKSNNKTACCFSSKK